jgi:hypothetical protein
MLEVNLEQAKSVVSTADVRQQNSVKYAKLWLTQIEVKVTFGNLLK